MIIIDRADDTGRGGHRYHFPTIDFKFQNRGNATAFLWQFSIEVLHAEVDVTPALRFEADVRDKALVITTKNNGWGTAYNSDIQLDERTLTLLFPETTRQYRGAIQDGTTQEIFHLTKDMVDSHQFEVIRQQFTNLLLSFGAAKSYGLKVDTMKLTWNCSNLQNRIEARVDPFKRARKVWWDIVLTEVGFEKVSYRDPTSHAGMESDTSYGAIIDPLKGAHEQTYPISRKIPPGDVERFHIMVGSPMSCYLQVRFKFFIDQTVVIASEVFDIQVWNPRDSGWHHLYTDDASRYRVSPHRNHYVGQYLQKQMSIFPLRDDDIFY